MNFCKNSDDIISLYIDGLLEDTLKAEFEKHLDECSACSNKYNEISQMVDLCRNDIEEQLPDGFELKLHSRLVHTKDKGKIKFIYNKKMFAALSTAAVLTISLFAYNLLPALDFKKDSNMESASIDSYEQKEDASIATAYDKRSNTDVATATPENGDVTITFSEPLPQDKNKDSETRAASSPSQKELQKKNDKAINEKLSSFCLDSYGAEVDDETVGSEQKIANTFSAARANYYENRVEYDLLCKEYLSDLKRLSVYMLELGAEVYEPIQNEGDRAYIEYKISKDIFTPNFIKNAKEKNSLEFIQKSEVIMTDKNSECKTLNKELANIDKDIKKANDNGDSTAQLELTKKKISDRIEKIYSLSDSIIIKIYFLIK